MSYIEIVKKNKENLEAYYYARKCIDVIDVPNEASKAFNEDVFENFLQELLCVKREYNQKNSDLLNVFWMLNLAYREQVHSAFIGELLNPRGLHGKGDAFLKLFCKKMQISVPSCTFKLLEYPFSLEQNGIEEKGRFDVYFPCSENSSDEIVIENKINASDGVCQLEKYHKFRPDAKLFYLTLEGKKASKKSTGGNDDFYIPISYKKDVLEWLNLCKKECYKDESLVKLIEQYENIVRSLTRMKMQEDEIGKVKDLLQKNEIFLNCINEYKSELNKEFEKYIVKSFENAAKSVGAEMEYEMIKLCDLDKKYSGISFKFKEWNDFVARLEFQEDEYKKIFYGVRYVGKKEKNEGLCVSLKNMFKSFFYQDDETSDTSSFLVGAHWHRYKNWDADCYLRVLDGSFERDLVNFLENIKYYMKACLPEGECCSS